MGIEGSFADEEMYACAKRIGDIATNSRTWFAYLWDKINGKKANWESNPFVWSVTFKQEKQRG